MFIMLNSVEWEKKLITRLKKLNILAAAIMAKSFNQIKNGIPDEVQERRIKHKAYTQWFMIRKMYARTIDDLFNETCYMQDRFQRFIRLGDSSPQIAMALEEVKKEKETHESYRIANGVLVLEVAYMLEDQNINLSEKELKTAFSISDREWDQNKVKEIPLITFVCQIGDASLVDQVVDAALTMIKNDKKAMERIHWKAAELLPELFNTL